MAITWERLVGDTSKFAIKIAFSDDPDHGSGATPEESSSWGSYQIWVKERNLCAHQFAGELSGSVHWYLLPLLEWFVEHWDPIFHEERLPNQNAAADSQTSLQRTREAPRTLSAGDALIWDHMWHDWWARHCIDAARAGGVYPSICIRRWRDKVELSWDGAHAAACPPDVQFVQSLGTSRLASKEVAVPLHSVLAEAASHLLSRCSGSEKLASLCARISELASPREDRLAWLLGLGTTLTEMRSSVVTVRQAVANLPAQVRDAVLGTSERAGLVIEPFPSALMFGSVSPHLSTNDRVRLIGYLAEAYGGARGRIDELAADEPVDSEQAWTQGYELAENILDDLGVQGATQERVDVEAILQNLGVRVVDTSLEDGSIRAVAIGGQDYLSTILLNRTHKANPYPTGRRFSLAHELCHLLYDRAFAREVALPSGPWAPRDVERRANAFAAMLLMPPDRIRQVIASSDSNPGSRELVLEVATRLQTSFTATVEHMCNLTLLSDGERDALLEEAIDRSGRPQS